MGATILKIDTSKQKILSEKQRAFLEKLENAPIMSDEEIKVFKKTRKWVGKWKI